MKDPLESIHFDSLLREAILREAIAQEEETAVSSNSLQPALPPTLQPTLATLAPSIASRETNLGMRVLLVLSIAMAILAVLRHQGSSILLFPILLGGMQACNVLLISIFSNFLRRGMFVHGCIFLTTILFTLATSNSEQDSWIWRAATIAAPQFLAIVECILFRNRSYRSVMVGGTWIAGVSWIYFHFSTLGTISFLFLIIGYSASLAGALSTSRIVESPELDKGVVLDGVKMAAS